MPMLAAEAEKLWHQTFLGCNCMVEMIGNYVMVGVPGDPVPKMRKLVNRLNEIIQTREKRNESNSPVE